MNQKIIKSKKPPVIIEFDKEYEWKVGNCLITEGEIYQILKVYKPSWWRNILKFLNFNIINTHAIKAQSASLRVLKYSHE